MNLRDLKAELERSETILPGFRVSFERREDGLLKSDYVPDRSEDPLSLTDAEQLASRMARMDPQGLRYVNIRVVRAHDHTPVGTQRWNPHPPLLY